MGLPEGTKLDTHKPRPRLILDLMAPALCEVIKVADYGAEKYSEEGYKHVPDPIKRYTDALYRHQLALACGETHDPESNLSHRAHIAWNALALLNFETVGVGAAGVPPAPDHNTNSKKHKSKAQNIRESWTQTYTGKRFDITNPRPEDVCIEDIARGLAGTCRFKGSTTEHYSVAEHSVHVLSLVQRAVPNASPHLKWHALMHDAAEAYLGDFPAPWKHLVSINGKTIKDVEHEIDMVILTALLPEPRPSHPFTSEKVSRADLAMVYQEKQYALPVNDLSWGSRFDNFTLQEDEVIELQFHSRDVAYKAFMAYYDSIMHEITHGR